MIIDRPPERLPGGCAPIWLAAITKHWFSIARARRSISQWSRVVASVNAAGTVSSSAPRSTERAVELGEADVVTDAHPECVRILGGGLDRRRRDQLARLLARRLGVDGAVDLDVEHVQLAVGRLDRAVGADVQARVGGLRLAFTPLDEGAGDQVDLQFAGRLLRPLRRRPIERLRLLLHDLRAAQHGPLLGKHDQLRALAGGMPGETIGGLEVALDVLGGVELHRGCA